MSFFVVKACNNKDIMNHQLKITSLINSIVTRKLHEENAYISWWLPFLHLLIFQCTKWALYKIALVKNTISNPFLNRFVFYGIEYKLLHGQELRSRLLWLYNSILLCKSYYATVVTKAAFFSVNTNNLFRLLGK